MNYGYLFIITLLLLADHLENVEHQDYLGNIDRPKTAIKRSQNTGLQFDEDATDLLPD